ncbi:MAG: ABC transporter ATP-binding protein [Candidatus Omnitrophica bacterium]|nr:ABC transporter ATP-binding protein [Candidatus Omnitrophota bacterium]
MLRVHNLHKVYNSDIKKLHVLKGIDLQIKKASFTAIVGPSGAGKSTLMHILAGLDAPSEGCVYVEDRDIYQLSDYERARLREKKIGFVFQFYHLLSEFTVLENVMLPALFGAKARFVKNEARNLLQRMGLSDRINHFPYQLSGGEKQRVAVARALINKPSLLFCDEPTGNLDSKNTQELISLIRELNSKEGLTVILVTHNQELTEAGDIIFYLKDGKLKKENQ